MIYLEIFSQNVVVTLMKLDTKISEIDLKLIQLLSQNARAPIRRIAKLMGVSEATVRCHINKLEQQGIIKGYSVVIDTTKINLPIFVTVGVEFKLDATMDRARRHRGRKLDIHLDRIGRTDIYHPAASRLSPARIRRGAL